MRCSGPHISNAENDRYQPSAPKRRGLAMAFGVPPEFLEPGGPHDARVVAHVVAKFRDEAAAEVLRQNLAARLRELDYQSLQLLTKLANELAGRQDTPHPPSV